MKPLLIAFTVCLVCAPTAVEAGSAGGAREALRAPLTASGGIPGATFTSICRFSHANNDDPIAFPRQPGASHNHSYFGNVSSSAMSTLASLRRAGTTCLRRADRAAYWAPTLFAGDGKPIHAIGASVYYTRATIKPATAFPPGLRMIAGDMHATAPQQYVSWSCGPESGRQASRSIPICPRTPSSSLRLTVRFPRCWNGRDLDSPDHRSHVAYAPQGICPSSHPVALPAISLTLRYPVYGGPGLRLSSGGRFSGHADFINAWNQRELVRLVRVCVNAGRQCGRGG